MGGAESGGVVGSGWDWEGGARGGMGGRGRRWEGLESWGIGGSGLGWWEGPGVGFWGGRGEGPGIGGGCHITWTLLKANFCVAAETAAILELKLEISC